MSKHPIVIHFLYDHLAEGQANFESYSSLATEMLPKYENKGGPGILGELAATGAAE